LKILVDKLPTNCSKCLFLGDIKEKTGCTLLKLKIPFEIGITTRLSNCPLVEQ